MPRVTTRDVPPEGEQALLRAGLPPLLARIYAARGICAAADLEHRIDGLLPVAALRNADAMATMLADAIRDGRRLLVVADYDADGATGCAVGVRALRAFGACVDYLVPNRFDYGYGLTPEIVRTAAERRPDLILTVDNGIASVEGVAEAKRLGIDVLVTDHHLPGSTLPEASCIVNPNQAGCDFPSKSLAGVGVMFYGMLALRAELRRRGAFASRPEPNLAHLLDLVALGTVADVVRLDRNNRLLVEHGLRRIRAGKSSALVASLLRTAGRDCARASTYDLGFAAGPRLNAAGRLQDMSIGIDGLTTDDATRATDIAGRLDALNRERREIEAGMQETALAALEQVRDTDGYSLALYDPDWHQGVIGILASRLKDRFHRPAITFAPGAAGELKGSGRSIRSLHLRDALDLVAKRHPGLVLRFGGHAAAAGLSIRAERFADFAAAFEETVRGLLTPADLDHVIETDGSLAPEDTTLDLAHRLEQEPWGQGFPAPSFADAFGVVDQRIVGGRHLKLRLARGNRRFNSVLFGRTDPLPAEIHAVYRLAVNEFNGTRALEVRLDHWAPLSDPAWR
ncbi:MAG TPA: single-stranded-DNA-specific exonuclease RecJ [Burkholderiales bacterium]|nr:single-stranded-DNA-specific exonuclease RecJ [Burkholderiales bacterium]